MNSYTIAPRLGIFYHYRSRQPILRDGEEPMNEADMQLHARVRSNDYFVTLATELEDIAQVVAADSALEAAKIERIVAELLKVNRQYKVIKKS